jgi:MFS family permease
MLSRSNLTHVNLKPIIVNLILVSNVFVWYTLIINLLKTTTQMPQYHSSSLLIWVLHFGGICISGLIGAELSKFIKKKTAFLFYWISFGFIVSIISTVAMTNPSLPSILAFSLLFGVSLGFGMPSLMGYFAETISVDKRGRVGGVIFLLTGLFIVVLETIAGDSLFSSSAVLSGWRLFGLVAFGLFLKSWHIGKPALNLQQPTINSQPSYRSFFNQKTFLLYLFPWLMFSLITNLTLPIQANTIQTLQTNGYNMPNLDVLMGIEDIFIAVSALFSGFLIDRFGRKRISIIGFVMIGLGYSVLGVLSSNPLCWYFYTFSDGVAWGIFFVIFVVTIWGDISNGKPSEKYYALGVLPFFISFFLRETLAYDLSSAISREAIFSFVAFFLFLAVLPLFYAPETLPEKQMKDRELKSYLEKALEKANKGR